MLDVYATRILRKNLDAFIRADPVMITLIRWQLIKTNTGSWKKNNAASNLEPQQFRLVTFKRRLFDFTSTGEMGYVPTLSYTLVGRHTCDILRDDEFYHNDDHYTVVSIEPKSDDRSQTDRVVAQLKLDVADKNAPV